MLGGLHFDSVIEAIEVYVVDRQTASEKPIAMLLYYFSV